MTTRTGVFRTPDERFEGLPGYDFEPHYLELSGGLAGLRVHYLDEGRGDLILLLHGEPTWAYLYRKMIPALAERARVVVPDYIGFGRSDKPSETGWYTYDRHCDALLQVIEALDLSGITVIVQDWGGPIGLRVATEHSERFARLVILNTGIFSPGPKWPSPAFLAWRDFAERNPDLPVGFVVQSATSTTVDDHVLAAYEAPFPTPESKAGAAAFPLLVPLSEEDPGAEEMAATKDALSRWEKPVLVAFSDGDPIFSPRVGERFVERIPGAGPMVTIENASHFLQEDAGERIAAEIVRFLDSTT